VRIAAEKWVFRKDQEMYVYLEAYQPTAETTQPLNNLLHRRFVHGFAC